MNIAQQIQQASLQNCIFPNNEDRQVLSLLASMRNCPLTNKHKPFKTYTQLVATVLRACGIKTVCKDLQIEIDRFYQVQNAQFKAQYPLTKKLIVNR